MIKQVGIYAGCLLLMFSMCVNAASLEKTAAHKDRSGIPITIKSNELNADNKGKTAVFTGKVVAKQDDVTIYSDKLIVNYADAKGEIKELEADGNVRIVQINRIGTANHVVYDSASGRITLTGNPKVTRDGDSITGKVITYYVDDDRSVVSGDGAKVRVEAVITPPARKGNAAGR